MESNQIPTEAPSNAVLDDPGLQAALLSIHPGFGDLCIRAAGEVWGTPRLSQRIKAFITIAIDVVNQGLDGPGSPFEAHIRMAIRQGATYEEIDELLLFTCVYAGFNKAAFAFGRWAEIRKKLEEEN
jgi:4-carboxymuconolactone decarboxylase